MEITDNSKLVRAFVWAFFLTLTVHLTCCEVIENGLVNKNVDSAIDLTTQLVKISQKITVENTGKSSAKFYLLTIDPKVKKNKVAFLGVKSGDSVLKLTEVKVHGQDDKLFWRVDLKAGLPSGKTVTLEVEWVLTHELNPHPSKITQREKQLVLYEGTIYFYTPYLTSRQKTVATLNSRNVESYSQISPSSHSENTITYGPYENKPSFSPQKMFIHFENNAPFLTITKLVRVIEVSHWGNIAVEETIDIEHTGAALKGPFSRYEYQRESQSGVASVKFFKTSLPASATDVYYRDLIGNISTSHMRILSDSVELDLRPRFPLFGGWRTHYTLGYNVPSYEYLYNSGDQFVLKMRLLDHIFDDMVIDTMVTKIILPEGSLSIELATPYPVQRLPDSLHFTYLDTKGRPVVSVTKQNLVDHHIDDFELKYSFARVLMLQEPLLVIVAFYLLFLVVIIYVRLDFSITKDELEESRMRTAGYCEKILSIQDKRTTLYQQLEDALSKLKASKDVNNFQSSARSINQEYKNACNQIAEITSKLKQHAGDVAEKVSELQRLDKQLREVYTSQQNLYVDKLVPGKIHRNSFLDAENEINKKKEEYMDKVNGIIKSLQ